MGYLNTSFLVTNRPNRQVYSGYDQQSKSSVLLWKLSRRSNSSLCLEKLLSTWEGMCAFSFFYASLVFFVFTYFCCLGLHHAELAPIGSVHRELGLRKYESESHSAMSDSLWPQGLYSPWNSPGQNTGVGSFSLLQGISPTQGLNPGLPYYRWILYQLSHKGSPRKYVIL